MKLAFEVDKILVPIDFSQTSLLALEHAAVFCQKFNSKIHLLHVYSGRDIDILPDVTAPRISQDDLKDKITEALKREADRLTNEMNITVDIEVREGSPAKEITLAARDAEAHMIIMGTHGTSGFEEFFIGSNAYKVVTSSELPVLTVRTNSTASYQKIFMGIDSTPHTRDKVSHVGAIARAFGSTVHLASLVTESHEDEIKIFNMKVKQIMEYFDHKGVKYEFEELHGDDIADMILDRSKELGCDLIAIMTEQEASTDLFVGSYAQRIVNHSNVPVLSVTPFEIVDKFSQADLGGDYRPFFI
jgi:nucleotide-binding universal stress UspA family protein